jgi:galactokinase
MIPTEVIARTFRDYSAVQPQLLSVAPGRINLLGEHVDYLGGRVLPAAIDRGISALGAPGQGGALEIRSLDFDDRVHWTPRHLDGPAPGGWATYAWGVLRELRALGYPWTGGSLLVTGDVPLGAGLSSSAALEVALLQWFTAAVGEPLGGADLALAARRVENEQVGTACGIMDQFVSVHGRAGQVLDLDCETLEYDLFSPALPDHEWVLVNSMVTHELGDQYNRIRAELEAAQAVLGPLVALPPDAGESPALSPSEIARARYVVGETHRTREFVAAAEAGDAARLGALLRATHRGLSELMGVSTPELDGLVELAAAVPGWEGGRMIGGGFGGCVLNLVRKDASAAFVSHIAGAFEGRFGLACEIYPVHLADGAHVIAI